MTHAGPMLLLGHRGASHASPENTLAAFARALDDEGADGIELDVRLSADGVPFVFHDVDLARMTDAPGKLEAMAAADLAALRVARDHPIPTLAALADALADRPRGVVNVELKPCARPRDLVAACLPALGAIAARHALIVSSFDPRALRLVADGGAGIAQLGLLFDDPNALAALPLLPPVDLHPAAALVTADAVAAWAIRAPGATLRTWTVDDAGEARRLHALGVRTIITNRPGPLRAELADLEPR